MGYGDARALLAAAESATRRRLTEALEEDGFDTVALTRTCDLLARLDADTFDAAVLVFDTELLVSPLEVIEVRAALPELPLTVVVPHVEQRMTRKLLRAGVFGVVGADDVERALAIAVRASLASHLCLPAESRAHAARPVMSHREKQVIELVARGFTNHQIAQELFLAESTVKSHLSTTFRKLGVRSRAEAAALVLDPEMRVELGLPEAASPFDQLLAST